MVSMYSVNRATEQFSLERQMHSICRIRITLFTTFIHFVCSFLLSDHQKQAKRKLMEHPVHILFTLRLCSSLIWEQTCVIQDQNSVYQEWVHAAAANCNRVSYAIKLFINTTVNVNRPDYGGSGGNGRWVTMSATIVQGNNCSNTPNWLATSSKEWSKCTLSNLDNKVGSRLSSSPSLSNQYNCYIIQLGIICTWSTDNEHSIFYWISLCLIWLGDGWAGGWIQWEKALINHSHLYTLCWQPLNQWSRWLS